MGKIAGLDLLRAPFPENQISKLPKPTKAQTEAVRADFKAGFRCPLCGAWHHKDVTHLDYVGHAALTDRLLDADPQWYWEPMALRDGLPAFDATGGLWIKLTVCGVSRHGYGHAAVKPSADPGSREKEVIGDALRNAAMRFGAALDLWHKGDLHVAADDAAEVFSVNHGRKTQEPAFDPTPHIAAIDAATTGRALIAVIAPLGSYNDRPDIAAARVDRLVTLVRGAQSVAAIDSFAKNFGPDWPSVAAEADARKLKLSAVTDNQINY
jgi:hypothetical protein